MNEWAPYALEVTPQIALRLAEAAEQLAESLTRVAGSGGRLWVGRVFSAYRTLRDMLPAIPEGSGEVATIYGDDRVAMESATVIRNIVDELDLKAGFTASLENIDGWILDDDAVPTFVEFSEQHAANIRLAADDLRKWSESSNQQGGKSIPPSRLSVSMNPPAATFDGHTYTITGNAAIYLRVLLEAGFDWVSGSQISSDYGFRVDRLSLPEALAELIEKSSGKGSRLIRSKVE